MSFWLAHIPNLKNKKPTKNTTCASAHVILDLIPEETKR